MRSLQDDILFPSIYFFHVFAVMQIFSQTFNNTSGFPATLKQEIFAYTVQQLWPTAPKGATPVN